MHADFNRHEKLRLDRRLNVLGYLNKDWKEAYGGALELWNREMTYADACVLPVFNRFVVFATTDFAYNGRPAQERGTAHSTLYQARPGERRAPARRAVERVTPPVLLDAARHARRRMVSH